MNSMSDRFRHWYEHERDCNAKTLTMLDSVPAEKRSSPDFQRAVELMAHMVAARRMWLYRLGHGPQPPGGWSPQGVAFADLPGMLSAIEAAWVKYLQNLSDEDLARELEWPVSDGSRWRWPVEKILTQVSCHAWYHRGQIVVLVGALGGKTMSTDLIFWDRPAHLEPAG
ncbi:MAG: DinB family protein [candidate division Zixibacteria bacterium]|nr:DinB family protein [candidate division Zixibacteria bacterium]